MGRSTRRTSTTGDRVMVRVLDPCSGGRMMWFDRDNQDVVFGDIRQGEYIMTDRSHGKADGVRHFSILPDIAVDFRALPFGDESFSLVVFDPPHIVRAGPKSWLAAKYGKLSDDWQTDIRKGFAECLRVLKQDGTLIFKWNETQVRVSDVLKLCPCPPLFGHRSGKKSNTHWLVFMKPNANFTLRQQQESA
jgi:SAM-dependent methyltransferase